MSDGGFLADDPLGRFLAEGGAMVAGAAALGAAAGYTAGALAQDLGVDVDPLEAAERCGGIGGAGALIYLIVRSAGVS